MNIIVPLALLFLARARRGGGVQWPVPPPPWAGPPGGTPPTTIPPTDGPPPMPPTEQPPTSSPPTTDEQPPQAAERYGYVRAGEGPYQFTARVVGRSYAPKWKHLLDANPNLRLNRARDNVTNATWKPGQQVKIPADWPGGETSVAGFDTV